MVEERLHLCSRLLNAHSGLETGEGPHGIAEASIGGFLVRLIETIRENHVGRLQRRKLEVPRQHANHARRAAIDIDLAVKDAWIAVVMVLP